MQLYRDEFGVITFDREAGILTLIWSEQTTRMSDEGFKRVNLALANLAEEHQAQKLLVNVEKFRFTFSAELNDWRAQTIIPKYHRAGVEKFAFAHGQGFDEPAGGQKNEGENFVTRHFALDSSAKAWLIES